MEKVSELQENASIGERRISLYSNRFFKSKFLLFRLKRSAKNYEDYSKESCMKIETFYFYTVALYHNEMKIDTMAKAFERKLMLNLVTQFPKIRGDMKT